MEERSGESFRGGRVFGWVGLGRGGERKEKNIAVRVGEYRARNGTKGTLRLLNCARTCVPLSTFPSSTSSAYARSTSPFPDLHIYTPLHPFSTTRENNDSAYLLLLPLRATLLFFTDSEFELFASRTRGHYPFQQKVTRERMSTRERERLCRIADCFHPSP